MLKEDHHMADYKKVLGCLVGAAAGDAMGAATEIRTRKQSEEYFGGYVKDFFEPPADTFARGSKAGQITDDFSVAYVTAQHIAKNGGKVTEEVAKEALLEWASIDEWFSRFAGPTTRARVAEIQAEEAGAETPKPDFVPVNPNSQATNGAGMKSAPIALFSNGNVDRAIEDAVIACSLTHPNKIALAGAAAIAAATAAALNDGANLFDVVQAGIYGARRGEELGLGYHEVAGCSIEKRIKLAVYIGLTAENLDKAIDEINDVIGAGLMAAEAIPAVFGLMVAAKGDTIEGICAGVNIGNDTDTVATMVGGILGALNGIDSMPEHYLEYLEEQNNIELAKLAKDICDLA